MDDEMVQHGVNTETDRKKLKSLLAALTHDLQIIDDRRECMKESIAEISQEFNIDKKIVRKLATTMYKHNYTDVVEEMEHFQDLYETLVEGRLSGADGDPLEG